MFELLRIYSERQRMYRLRIMEEEKQLFNRLGGLPIVNDTYSQVINIYERTKGHNILFRSMLGLAESTARIVAGKAVPIIVNRYQPQIDLVNHYACDKLDVLEEKFPIITRPTAEVLREGKEKYEEKLAPYFDPVLKPTLAVVNAGVSAVNLGTSAGSAVIQTGKKTVDNVTKLGTDAVTGVVGFGVNQVTKVIHVGQNVVEYGFQTPYGVFFLDQIDVILDISDDIVDKYLPNDENEVDETEARQTEQPETRRDRMKQLVKRTQSRLEHRVRHDLKHYKEVSMETIENLRKTFDVISLVKSKGGVVPALQEARKEALVFINSVLNQHGVESGKESNEIQDIEEASLTLARILSERIQRTVNPILSRVHQRYQTVSGYCKEAFTFTQDTVTTLAKATSVHDLSTKFVKTAQEILPYVEEMVAYSFDLVIDKLDWFRVDINMEMEMIEMDVMGMHNCSSLDRNLPPVMENHNHVDS